MKYGDLSALQIKRLYEELIRQITPLMSDLVFSSDEPFSFLKNAKINQLLNQFLAEISQKMHTSIERSTKEAWELSVLNNQKFFEPYLNSGLLSAEQILHYNNRNIEALQSFLNRKTGGLHLSDRIWNLTKQFKTELEMSLDIGLSQGKPATEIALDIMNYLHQPNALLQKVRQFRGSLHLSKMVDKMKQADPVLGSSYNKAMRLARTEVNMAYRASDLEKYRQLDFVLGYEIKRSNHPYGCPVCESLKGKYPKDFQFVGWHPNCRCYTVPILQKLEDFLEEKPITDEIKDVPDNFKQWATDNTQRMLSAQSVPYWWRDNKKYVERGLAKEDTSKYDTKLFESFGTKQEDFINAKPHQNALKINKSIRPAESFCVDRYCDDFYREVNPYLRNGRIPPDDFFERYIKVMNGGMEKLPTYQGEVYRGADLPPEAINKYKKALETGKPITENYYLSTSRLEEKAFDKNTSYIIQSKTGKMVEDISYFQSEREVLFREGTKFKILKVDFENGKNLIYMEEI